MKARTHVTATVWWTRCPHCDAPVDIARTDAGQYDGIEVAVDCAACAATFYTDTVVVVVTGTTLDAARSRAARIRGPAERVTPSG